MKKLHFVETDFDDDYYTYIYYDEDGKRYDFIYKFMEVKTQDENGNWVEPDEDWEYEIV